MIDEWICKENKLPKEEKINGVRAIYTVIKKKDGKRTFCSFYKKHYKTKKPEFVCIGNGKITKITHWHPLPKSIWSNRRDKLCEFQVLEYCPLKGKELNNECK